MKNRKQKMFLLTSISIFLVLALATRCDKTQEEAWNKFLIKANDCEKTYKACVDCEEKAKQYSADYAACLRECGSAYNSAAIACTSENNDWQKCFDSHLPEKCVGWGLGCQKEYETRMAELNQHCSSNCLTDYKKCLGLEE